MSVEGMWCFVSGNTVNDAVNSGGVVILDTLRLYGGDTAMAYVGRYEANGGRVLGRVESFRYNSAIEGVDVFGEPMGPTRQTEFDLNLEEDDLLVGVLRRDGRELPIILKKLRELP